MTQKTKHTPLPWRVAKNYPDCVYAKGGVDVARCFGGHNRGKESLKPQANAAFIVRACNSHQALMDALEEAKRLLDFAGCGSDKVDAALNLARGE